jgi:muramoyltetrapeptide carboxypeptidase
MRKPKALKPGDTIRIVSPASPLTSDKLQKATELLEGEGYKVEVSAHALDSCGYLAGVDADRCFDLQEAFADPTVGAIYCSRGGYGCARIMPHLDVEAMAASGKMFLGFSDITTLHLALNKQGLVTMHAPMAITLSSDREPWVVGSFLNALKGDAATPADAPGGETYVGGTAEGEVTGGCLCLLTDSIGTPYALDTRGKILLIEDVDENPHRIDAMLTHLVNSGSLDEVAGIVIGEMTRTDERVDEAIGAMPWRDIVRDRLSPLGVPLIVDFPFGHMKNMLTLPLGIRAQLDADAGTLTYIESPCA